MVPAHVESDVDLLEANMEPTPSKRTSWWPLALAIAAVGLFVLVGIAFKTHRRDVLPVPTEGAAGYFAMIGSENISENISVPVKDKHIRKEVSEIAISCTDGFKKGVVTDFSTFARKSVFCAKADMERQGIKANVFGGVCDSFSCSGCDEDGKAIKTSIRVKDGKFCLVMAPQNWEFTIQIPNPDKVTYFWAGDEHESWDWLKKTTSIDRKGLRLSLSFGDKAKNFSAAGHGDASLSS
eukprot:Skav215926  [mRNA]  locus=scaffold226:281492:282205:+ [translate_table: standard]